MRVLRAGEHRRMKWKNGGGETAEIAVFPEGAGLNDFLWRISMAHVASDGPFSLFPGIDRTLAILSGAGISLDVADCEPRILTPETDPVSFPGDVAASAALIAGPITDFNVMTRRGAVSHEVHRIAVDGHHSIPLSGEPFLLLCTDGGIVVNANGSTATLGPSDAMLCTAAINATVLTGRGEGYGVFLRA